MEACPRAVVVAELVSGLRIRGMVEMVDGQVVAAGPRISKLFQHHCQVTELMA